MDRQIAMSIRQPCYHIIAAHYKKSNGKKLVISKKRQRDYSSASKVLF